MMLRQHSESLGLCDHRLADATLQDLKTDSALPVPETLR